MLCLNFAHVAACSIFSSLSPQTKVILGGGAIVWGVTGLFVTDIVENEFGLMPSDEEKERLKKIMPTVRAVELNSNGSLPSATGDQKP